MPVLLLMGQILSEPVTAKESAICQNEYLCVGSSCMQGWRVNMEDAHTIILSLPDDPSASFFGVYDGHGGFKVAEHAGKNLHKYVLQQPEYLEGNIEEALKQGFLKLDEDMQNDPEIKNISSGSTACCILIKNHKANLGDSRCVASINGIANALSFDHKPSNEIESTRILDAGGYIEFDRVNGNLALSRAFGDFSFKKNDQKSPEEQMVIALPDIQVHELTDNWEFCIIACDGIWEVLTNQEVVDFICQRIAKNMEPETISEDLLNHCLSPDCQTGGTGCDNMTVILVCFLHGKSYKQLGESIASSLKQVLECQTVDQNINI